MGKEGCGGGEDGPGRGREWPVGAVGPGKAREGPSQCAVKIDGFATVEGIVDQPYG